MTISLGHSTWLRVAIHLLYEPRVALWKIALHIYVSRIPFFGTSQFNVPQRFELDIRRYIRVEVNCGTFCCKRYEAFVVRDTEVFVPIVRVVGYVYSIRTHLVWIDERMIHLCAKV